MIKLLVVLFGLGSHPISVDESRFIVVLERVAQLPDVEPEQVLPTTIAAFYTETDEYPAELLLALAWSESRFEPTTITGHAYGVLQVSRIPSACRSAVDGYRAGVAELQELARDRRTSGQLDRVLLYRACGNAAFNGTCTKQRWVTAALHRARRLGMRNVRPLS